MIEHDEGLVGPTLVSAGDVDGDGYGDFIIGDEHDGAAGVAPGGAWFVQGGPNGI